jgi:hypothetical protein
MTSDIERIAILEQQVRDMRDDVHETRKKVEQLHDMMMRADGARYVIIGAAALAGSMTGFLVKFIPWINAAPLK